MPTVQGLRLGLGLVLLGAPALADPARVVEAAAERGDDGLLRLHVTVAHPDTGWEHYADAWEVRAPDGTVLGTRELLHPHVTEQPFTRSLGGVAVPEGLREVEVRARCLVDGWTGEALTVRVP